MGAYRFLIIDDDEDARLLHRKVLERTFPGCTVAEAMASEEVLRLAAIQRFDAVISDHQLTGETGTDCTRELRAHQFGGPIIMLTGSLDPKLHESARVAGVTRVFSSNIDEALAFLRHELESPDFRGPDAAV